MQQCCRLQTGLEPRCCSSYSTPSSRPAGLLHGSCRARRCRTPIVAAKTTVQQYSVAVDPYEPPLYRQGTAGATTRYLPIIISAAAAFGVAYWFKAKCQAPVSLRKVPEPWPEIPRPELDPKAYSLALARTRQAQHVAKAVSFMHTGEPSRAAVELGRALHENDLCRSPLLDGHQTKEELVDLYKLHIKNTETIPPSFATLLQLREMLGLGNAEAEAIEADVLQEGACFSI